MKMADGEYRPAYNVRYASDCASQMVVGVEVSTVGSDMAQLARMVEQRVGRTPISGWSTEAFRRTSRSTQWRKDRGVRTSAQAAVPRPSGLLAPLQDGP